MARMIPDTMSPDVVKSAAERKIFDWFHDAPETSDWIVLHSLGLVNHDKVIFGEMDFLVLAPGMGLFALEVKGGRVKRTNGKWSFTNRYGHTDTKERGPFDQAKEGIFSLMRDISNRLDEVHQPLGKQFFGYGVMFPDITFIANGPDEAQWQVFDERDSKDVAGYIRRLFQGSKEKWEQHYGHLSSGKLPTAEDVCYIAELLRGDFDYIPSLGSQLKNAESEFLALTTAQYKCLDMLADNKRLLVQGGAGTGKTLMAVEAAKRAVAAGRKTALICYNSNLAAWLRQCFDDVSVNLRPAFIGTFHGFMHTIATDIGIRVDACPEKGSTEYYNDTLPNAAIVALTILGTGDYDSLIVDEMQDIISEQYLNVMDAALKDGLKKGRWSFFGDFNSQAIYSRGMSADEMLEMLEEHAAFSMFRLTENCRNSLRICNNLQTVTGVDTVPAQINTVVGPVVNYLEYDSEQEAVLKLEQILSELQSQNVYPERISILSTRKRENSIVRHIPRVTIADYKPDIKMKTMFSTVHAFKGLENAFVILTDVENFTDIPLLYVAMSRARFALYVLLTKEARSEYDSILSRRVTNGR